MILSHEHKFIFVHLGRTGGTSIEQTLSGLIGMNFQRTYRNEEILAGGDCKHLSASRLKAIVGDRIWDEYFTFAFVRNPYDRLLSGWSLEKSLASTHDWVDPVWTRFDTFEEFLDALALDGTGEISSHDSQLSMVADERGDFLVDFVGRFERLQEDFDAACRRIGLPSTRLLLMGESHHKPWPDYYTPARETAVKRRFGMDFAAFGYPGRVPRAEPVLPGPGRGRPGAEVTEMIGECLDRLSRDPADVEALVRLGHGYAALGAHESAEALFHRAREAAPGVAAARGTPLVRC